MQLEWTLAGVGMAAMLDAWRWRRRAATQMGERWRERRLREELEAYARLNPTVTLGQGQGDDPMEQARTLARRVCRTIAERSAFTRVAMLLRDREGRLVCVGSVGTDDLTTAALHAWGEKLVAEEREGRLMPGGAGAAGRSGGKSFAIPLGEWSSFDREVGTWAAGGRKERRRWRRGMVAPLRTGSGRMTGALVVCADGGRLDGSPGDGWSAAGPGGGLVRAMVPIETLAERLSAAMENETLMARLVRTEKLAGLGQLAGGVAHALNNPLTAVMGFAELIAETADEPRVRKDAATILAEAKKMRETVQRLSEFWRPAAAANEHVDVAGLLQDLEAACAETLEARGVKLQVTVGDSTGVRGSRDRLRQVFEHLLNNAAQAIATARPREEGEQHAIRVSTSEDGQTLHVIVSDTGPGFREPARVFDPFYTTRGPEQGAGMGLSICYGIVREHGGEISAFNLHPHGAAVVVELPVGVVVAEESRDRVVVRQRQQSEA